MPYELVLGLTIAVLAVGLLALRCNYRRDLMMFQQNSYMPDRYGRWFNESWESTNYIRIGACISVLMCLAHNLPYVFGAGFAVVIMAWISISLIRRKYKKPLVMTRRAWRIYGMEIFLSAAVIAVAGVLTHSWQYVAVAVLALNVLSPLMMMLSNLILKPVEKHINRGFYNEARDILRSMPYLKIIGVTGSYGKTSTKHYLNRILSEKYDVMMTPGNFNTTLGVIRTVREHLKPYNEVFIVEMGAKQLGDIKEICDLVHPQIGIVTAVGPQHLESFKSIENVQRTKFELVDSLPSDGLAVVNADFEMAANRPVGNVACVRYGIDNKDADYVAEVKSIDATGTSFTVAGAGKTYEFHTRLVGQCNVSNLTAAVIVALQLGVEIDKIRYAVEKIEQVEHRLNMKRTAGGVTIIDDAYNSNPTGSKMAVDVLSAMTSGKRIMVTPGMVELGERQYELNKELGRYAAQKVDVIIVVGEYNREAICEGLAEGGADESKVKHASTFAEAQDILSQILKNGDIVLYENDLPDTFK